MWDTARNLATRVQQAAAAAVAAAFEVAKLDEGDGIEQELVAVAVALALACDWNIVMQLNISEYLNICKRYFVTSTA
jgi:hypothetical protein